MGLDISKSIPKASRSAPGVPGENGDTPTRGIGMGMTEHEKLREDIAKLQLSSRSSSTSGSVKDSPTSPSFPTQSDNSSSSVPKKGKTKKTKVDKEGLELVKDEDLQILGDIGAGNGGTVTKVFNKKRKCIMARKVCCLSLMRFQLTSSSSWSMPNRLCVSRSCGNCRL
jgi:mitogen-activated protein kinase kinase